MFWRFGNYNTVSPLDALLDKPDVTLEEVLDDNEVLVELKQSNSKLIEFLREETALRKLLEYVVAPNPFEKDGLSQEEQWEKLDGMTDEERKQEEVRTKRAHIASEVLSSDTWSIVEALIEQRDALLKFWTYLEWAPPLDPIQASYFTKVNEMLIDKKPEEMFDIFKSLDSPVKTMLRHVDCPMMMDLLLKIIALDRIIKTDNVAAWLHSQELITTLLSYLSPEHSSATQTSAGDFLKAVITISANASLNEQSCIGPNELTRQLVSEACVQSLLKDMLNGGNPLTVGVGIVIEVIRKNNSDWDPEVGSGPESIPTSHDPIYLGTLLRLFAEHVPEFMALILKQTGDDGEARKLKVAFGDTIEPLGFDRFKTCELMAELLHCSNMGLLNEKGGEKYIRERDTERERLNAGGTPRQQAEDFTDTGSVEDLTRYGNGAFGSSFTSLQETDRPVDEDGFEEVKPSEALNAEPELKPSSKSIHQEIEDAFEDFSASTKFDLSKSKRKSAEGKENTATPAAESENVKSPAKTPEKRRSLSKDETSPASLVPQVNALDIGKKGDEKPTEKDSATETAVAEQPAPLFANRKRTGSEPQAVESEPGLLEERDPDDTFDATLDEGESMRSVLMSTDAAGLEPQVQLDVDGNPVVGDLLKVTFVQNKVIPTILDFFFRFPWNNFLHNVVYDVVQQVFNGPMDRGYNRTLATDVFETGRITERIIQGQRDAERVESQRNMRLGYLGHLTLIAEEVVKFTDRHSQEALSQAVLDRVSDPDWIHYVEHTLAETRERDNAILGGVRPDANGPRQAVLNAVNAQLGFGSPSQALAGVGLTAGLDAGDMANGSSTLSYALGGSLLSSGFGSSSDEEDEEIEEEGEEAGYSAANGSKDETSRLTPEPRERDRVEAAGNQAEDDDDDAYDPEFSNSPDMPPAPLNIHGPSRARQQLAKQLKIKEENGDAGPASPALPTTTTTDNKQQHVENTNNDDNNTTQ